MTRATLAHIVGGGPVWPLWITGTLLFGGAVGTMAASPSVRRACFGVCLVGLVATAVVYVSLPSAPAAPRGLTVRIATPAAGANVTSPVLVTVCGSSTVPGPGQLISVSVDGRQVAEVNAETAAVPMTAGMHTLRVELVTTDHRAYAPPILTDESVTVSGVGPLASAVACPLTPAAAP